MDFKRTFPWQLPNWNRDHGRNTTTQVEILLVGPELTEMCVCVCAPSTRNSVGFRSMSLVDVTAPCLTSSIGTRAQQLAQKELGG